MEAMRAAFEEWYAGPDLKAVEKNDHGVYKLMQAQAAWTAWAAAWEAAAATLNK